MRPLDYHDLTKHHFNRFARSLGYLDWATQPDPFRRYSGSRAIELSRAPVAGDVPYAALYDGSARPLPVEAGTVAELLRCSMGLSAWKEYGATRWALRVNPSSGNLHPTEAYVVWDGRVCHYAPRDHLLEERCDIGAAAWNEVVRGGAGLLVALTSITWRESWKYGERAFRYCQHDVGHAIGALRLAAAMLGWSLTLLPNWADDQIATMLGLDREEDYGDAEREEPECLAIVGPTGALGHRDGLDPSPLVRAAAGARWQGRANRLSPTRVPWPAIDDVARVTRHAGSNGIPPMASARGNPDPERGQASPRARSVILRRRSALGFDAHSTLPTPAFHAMLKRLVPPAVPWDALDWPPHVHLMLFVHRVEGLVPGLYAFLRDPRIVDEWRSSMRAEFLWEEVAVGLFLLVPTDVAWAANRLSCDQDIAADGFFSLGMLAPLEASLATRGDAFYRRLFWECGVIGQVLYLEAEAAGARATGIGCFYDDPVHETLGLSGHRWQSLYHFSMGVPVEDARLTTRPGYEWEASIPEGTPSCHELREPTR